MRLLEWTYYGNPASAWLGALAMAVVAVVGLHVLMGLAIRRLARRAEATRTEVDDLAVDLLRRTRFPFLLALAVYAGSFALDLAPGPSRALGVAAVIAILVQIALWGNLLIAFAIARYVKTAKDQDPAAATTVTAFGFIARLMLWTIIVLLALDNLGVNVTALVAGLGVGGIAVALALQNVLGDLFASFSIVLDKPFVVGDFIIVDDYLGTVEHIGLKTTRIRSLSGEQIVFSNADLLGSRVRNYKRMYVWERRT